jgi:hypothetical protein
MMKNFSQTVSYLENKRGATSYSIKKYVENQGYKEEKEAYKQMKMLNFHILGMISYHGYICFYLNQIFLY